MLVKLFLVKKYPISSHLDSSVDVLVFSEPRHRAKALDKSNLEEKKGGFER